MGPVPNGAGGVSVGSCIMDSHVAFLAGLLLLLCPAIPLAIAWVRLIPGGEETEKHIPFDGASVLMLLAVTLSYVLLLSGITLGLPENRLNSRLPADLQDGLWLATRFLTVYLPVSVLVYARSRRGPLRELLLWAGLLALLAWLAKSYLLPFWVGAGLG